jgi:SET domain-containing protein
MSQEKPKIVVRPSSIHKFGAFAGSFIPKGTILPWENTREMSQEEFSKLPPNERRFTDIQDGKMFLVGEPERYVNHSCDNNTAPGPLCDIAIRDIKEDEEITSDYSNFFILDGSFKCDCGSRNCRGVITGRQSE